MLSSIGTTRARIRSEIEATRWVTVFKRQMTKISRAGTGGGAKTKREEKKQLRQDEKEWEHSLLGIYGG